MTLARFSASSPLCSLSTVSSPHATSQCGSTYASSDALEIDDSPGHAVRCGECERVLAEGRIKDWRGR
jgi:hypothetical protein